MADIAVIVPVYNAENYLDFCVNSVLSQSFRDFTLILVDDGSQDRSSAICDEYAKTDARVRVVHQNNHGPSAARNRGIELALQDKDCRYIAFVDSDDRIHPQYLSFLRGMADMHCAKVAMCRHRYITPTEPLTAIEEIPEEQGKLVDAETLMCNETASFNYAWGKLFSIECFSTLRFPEEVSFGEDNLTVYKALFASERIAFSERRLYYYYYNPEGITKTHWNPANLQCFLGNEEQLAFYREHGFDRAYRKEIELHIQQFAYQLHRIRDDKKFRWKNEPYRKELRKRMKLVLSENPGIELKNNFYWYEALHPIIACLKSSANRLNRNIRSNGFAGTLRKIIGKKSIKKNTR